MKATVNVVYGIGNAVEVNLEALEGAEHTIKMTVKDDGGKEFTSFLEHPVTVGDIVLNANVKAILGHDNVTVKCLGISVGLDVAIGGGTTTLVLEDLQSTKN